MIIALDIVIALLAVVGFCIMLKECDPEAESLQAAGLHALRYFTVLSNILCGIDFGIAVILSLTGADGVLIALLKYTGTVGVAFTFLVTAGFLAPSFKKRGRDPMALYQGANILFHLVVPVLSVVSWCLSTKPALSFTITLAGLLPILLYAVYYMIDAFGHREGQYIMKGHDWYGFLRGGVRTAPVILPIILIAAFALCALIWAIR